MEQADRLKVKLSQTRAELGRAKEKRARIEAQIAILETDEDALRRALDLIGERSNDLPILDFHADGGALSAILAVTEPGETFKVHDLIQRIEADPSIRLDSQNPANAISTALSRARERFERVKRGEYKRLDGEREKQETPPPSGSGALSLN